MTIKTIYKINIESVEINVYVNNNDLVIISLGLPVSCTINFLF